jgi:hypothetical protein
MAARSEAEAIGLGFMFQKPRPLGGVLHWRCFMIKSKLFPLWPPDKEDCKGSRILMVLLLIFIFVVVVPSSITYAQGAPDEGLSFRFIFGGYSDKLKANEAFLVKTQEEMERIIQEMGSSEYIPFFHDLLPEPGWRIDFLPVVDFKEEAVIAVVGKKHDSPCRKTKVVGVKKDRLNDLTIDVEETFSKLCKLDKLAARANPVILFKVKGPVARLKNLNESVKKYIEE